MKSNQSYVWHYILDENKKVVPTKDYALINDFYRSHGRIIRRTCIRDKLISTVLLHTDHDFEYESLEILMNLKESKPNPNPIIFETMICCKSEGWLDYEERYMTYPEALKGHRLAVRRVINSIRTGKQIED